MQLSVHRVGFFMSNSRLTAELSYRLVVIDLLALDVGIAFGFGISRLIAWLAGWSTVTTLSSIVLAFAFSVSVGLLFGIYPARQAARLDPVEAIRYE